MAMKQRIINASCGKGEICVSSRHLWYKIMALQSMGSWAVRILTWASVLICAISNVANLHVGMHINSASFWPTWDASALPKKIYLVLSRILSRTWHHDGWKHTARNIQRRMAGNCWRTHAILELSCKDLARLKTEGQLWPSPQGCMGCRFPGLSGCMQNANCDIHVTTSKGRHHVHAQFAIVTGLCSYLENQMLLLLSSLM